MSDIFGKFGSIFGMPRNNPRNPQEETEDFNIQRFNVYTDPLEMHRYFESQINEMLRIFTGIGNLPFDSHSSESSFLPTIPDSGFSSATPGLSKEGDIRNEYLKPGYKEANIKKQDFYDSDLDGKITSEDFINLMPEKNNTNILPEMPWNKLKDFKTHFYSTTTVITKHPDGTVEKRLVERDNLGNEKTTIEVTKPQRGHSNIQIEDFSNDDHRDQQKESWLRKLFKY